MNGRTLWISTLVGLLSAGCAYLPPSGPSGDHGRYGGYRPPQPSAQVECNANGPCDIRVDVVTMIGNGVARTTIVAPDAKIAKGNHGVTIHWHITNPDYTFKDDGIAFYEASSAGQFSGPSVGGRGEEFHFTDRNTDTHGYGYQIKVYNRKTGDWLTLDPYIWNNN
ncbi:MAG TPA: hypothetical protein VFK60_07280 [Casimicrobiaceae bacterium]|nr:hypothetical protein [Casimicrobiaceae bacterium]